MKIEQGEGVSCVVGRQSGAGAGGVRLCVCYGAATCRSRMGGPVFLVLRNIKRVIY